jgi:hypothetical protein
MVEFDLTDHMTTLQSGSRGITVDMETVEQKLITIIDSDVSELFRTCFVIKLLNITRLGLQRICFRGESVSGMDIYFGP